MIRKAVIPAAGFGTRMLPATIGQPKEMLSVIGKPIVQYVAEEAVASGIEDIIIVTRGINHAIEDHFTVNSELEQWLEQQGKIDLLEKIRWTTRMANFIFVHQQGRYGNGTPVLNSKSVVGQEPFVLMWGDTLVASNTPRLKQMIKVYEKYGGIVISSCRVENDIDFTRYGIADIEPVEANVFKIKNVVEKPGRNAAPSNLALRGAYILPPDIFDALESQKPGRDGEVWLIDGINYLREQGVPMYACEVKDATFFDCGDPFEYLVTNLEFALNDPDLSQKVRNYLLTIKP